MPDRSAAPIPDPAHDIPYSAEVKRKALHLLALVVPVLMALIGNKWSILILVPTSLVFLGADALRARSTSFAAFVDRLFGFMMRGEERNVRSDSIVINGATWVLVTAALLVLIFPLRIAVASFVMFMVADAAAALFGRRFGRHRWPNSSRTLEGSSAFVITGVIIMFLFRDIAFWTGTVSVVLGAGAEVVRRPLNDNIRVPLVTATTLYLLERFVMGMPVQLFNF